MPDGFTSVSVSVSVSAFSTVESKCDDDDDDNDDTRNLLLLQATPMEPTFCDINSKDEDNDGRKC